MKTEVKIPESETKKHGTRIAQCINGLTDDNQVRNRIFKIIEDDMHRAMNYAFTHGIEYGHKNPK